MIDSFARYRLMNKIEYIEKDGNISFADLVTILKEIVEALDTYADES